MEVTITRVTHEAITAHAVADFPNECCGFVVRRAGRQEVVPVSNIQDRLHALDPQQYPRTAATAYSMGAEQLPIVRGHECGELSIQAVYHSHPQHDAYFSEEDRRNAAPGGEPMYPRAGQIVVSVYDGKVKAVNAFGWDDQRRDFGAVELRVTDEP